MIRAKRAELARQRAALEKQDAELAIAERVLAEMEGVKASSPQQTFEIVLSAPSGSRRERVLEALGGDKIWMTSAEINNAIAKRHGVLIKGTSLYPMLTNLKKEGVIIRQGDRMALKGRLEKEQADLIAR